MSRVADERGPRRAEAEDFSRQIMSRSSRGRRIDFGLLLHPKNILKPLRNDFGKIEFFVSDKIFGIWDLLLCLKGVEPLYYIKDPN